MNRRYMNRKYWIKELKRCIRFSRKLSRQIDRKVDSLAKFNKLKAAIKLELVKLSEKK